MGRKRFLFDAVVALFIVVMVSSFIALFVQGIRFQSSQRVKRLELRGRLAVQMDMLEESRFDAEEALRGLMAEGTELQLVSLSSDVLEDVERTTELLDEIARRPSLTSLDLETLVALAAMAVCTSRMVSVTISDIHSGDQTDWSDVLICGRTELQCSSPDDDLQGSSVESDLLHDLDQDRQRLFVALVRRLAAVSVDCPPAFVQAR